jgi:hypothetical protein
LALVKAGHGGMSTAVVAEIVDGQVVGASVGDSCAWLVSLGEVSDLTERQVRKPLLGSGVSPAATGGTSSTSITGYQEPTRWRGDRSPHCPLAGGLA